jgi:hypothetical protein
MELGILVLEDVEFEKVGVLEHRILDSELFVEINILMRLLRESLG